VKKTRASRQEEQDSQAPGALMAALIKHTKFPKAVVKQVQMSKMKAMIFYMILLLEVCAARRYPAKICYLDPLLYSDMR